MTPDRRQALIDILEHRTIGPGSLILTPDEARDLLALIREPELPTLRYGVQDRGTGEVFAAFANSIDRFKVCERMTWDRNGYNRMVDLHAIDPDLSDCPPPGCGGDSPIPEAVMPGGCPSCGGPTEYDREDPPNPYYCDDCEYEYAVDCVRPPTKEPAMQTITFRPYTPPRPTLDQMPEGEPHIVHFKGRPEKYQECLARYEDMAYRVSACGNNRLPVSPAREFTVLDADPPQPKTLADVPAWVVCVDEDGDLCWIDNLGEVQRFLSKEGDKAEYIAITRVLGFPVLEGVGDE